MELPCISFTVPNPPTVPFCGKLCLCDFPGARKRRTASLDGASRVSVRAVRGSTEQRGSEGIDGRDGESRGGGGFTSPAMEVTTFNSSFGEAEFPVWEKVGAVVRLSYGIGE